MVDHPPPSQTSTSSPVILWEKCKHDYFARLDLLERAAIGMLKGSLSPKLRVRAQTAAHELARGAGEYGFVKGVTLAEEIEDYFAREEVPADKGVNLLHKIMELNTELRAVPSCVDQLSEEPSSNIAPPAAVKAGSPSRRAKTAVKKPPAAPAVVATSTADMVASSSATLGGSSSTAALEPATPAARASTDSGPASTAGSRIPERPASGQDRVVYLENDVEVRDTASGWLREQGFEVFTADDGLKGLEMIRLHRPKLVLLALMLPRMHGYAVCEAIRQDPNLKDTIIIVVSSKAYAVDIKKAQDVGANAFLHKPFDAEELKSKIKEALKSTSIRVKFWGTRGSIATPGMSTVRYGGNTSCIEVRYGETLLLLDCGTGARELGISLAREYQSNPMHAHILVSHSHWDHIQGFPFFSPAYVQGNKVTLYSLRGADKSLEKVFAGQMDSSYFPVSVADMMSHLEFVELEGPVSLGGATISHIFLNHPGLAVGFRIDLHGKSLVYLTDHEPFSRMSGENDYNLKLDRAITEFAHGADLYIREAQYTDEEYPQKKGWGHSTWSDALSCAHKAGVRSLALFHHDPLHDDHMMDRIGQECRASMLREGMTFSFVIASDYMELSV